MPSRAGPRPANHATTMIAQRNNETGGAACRTWPNTATQANARAKARSAKP